MEPPVISFVTSDTEAGSSDPGYRKIRVIVPRSRAYLVPLLAKAFEGRKEVEILVRERPGEAGPRQRAGATPIKAKSGASVRKRPKEEAIEVVIEGAGRLEEPREIMASRTGSGAGRG
jgi:hypothetical protein